MKKISTLLLVLMALLAPMTVSADNYDVEAATIAEFNAAEDGKVVKLTLTDARVNAYNDLASTYYVEDASGATAIKGIGLTVCTKLNGYIVGKKASEDVDYVNDPSHCIEPSLTVTDASLSAFEATAAEMVGTTMTIAEVGTQANHGKLVKLSDVTITHIGNGKNWELADAAGNTIKTRDLFGVLPEGYVWPRLATEMTGVVNYYMTGWFLIPVSADAIVENYVSEFDFLNNNLNLPVGSATDVNKGNLGGKTISRGNVDISLVNSSTMPTRYYFNANKNQLQVIGGGQIRFTATEGRAITKIEITPVAASNNKWGVDGEVGSLSEDKLTWEGNTTTVRFTATGALYLTKIVVTTIAKDANTVTPADTDTYTEVASLAEFNALANGTLAKLNLTDAIITSGMVNGWGYYIQDATAGAHFYCTELNFDVNDALNGYVYVKKDFSQPGLRIAMIEKTNADKLTITHDATYTPVEGTFAEVVTLANNNKVVKLTGAIKGSAETEATLTAGEQTLAISNGKTNYAPYVYQEDMTNIDYASATVVGILWTNTKGDTFKLYPISITEGSGSGIETIHHSQFTVNNSIYNLQGIRLNSLQRGLNIVNGKKVFRP